MFLCKLLGHKLKVKSIHRNQYYDIDICIQGPVIITQVCQRCGEKIKKIEYP